MEARIQEGSKDWWIQKYETSSTYLFGKGPSDFLRENISFLKTGETIDIGMGEGRNAVYLASKGFQVTGIDFCPVAVERAKQLAKETGVTFEAKLQDLQFFLMPLMKYNTIAVIDCKLPLTLLKGLARGLANGGTLLIENYTMEQLKQPGYKPDPTECYRSNELLDHVRDLQIIYYNERIIEGKPAKVELLARKNLR